MSVTAQLQYQNNSTSYPDSYGGQIQSANVYIALTDSSGNPVAGNGTTVDYTMSVNGVVTQFRTIINGSNTSIMVYSGNLSETHYAPSGALTSSITTTFAIPAPNLGSALSGQINVNFTIGNGQTARIKFRKTGTTTWTTFYPEPSASPAIIPNLDETLDYDVSVETDCGNNTYSDAVVVSAPHYVASGGGGSSNNSSIQVTASVKGSVEMIGPDGTDLTQTLTPNANMSFSLPVQSYTIKVTTTQTGSSTQVAADISVNGVITQSTGYVEIDNVEGPLTIIVQPSSL